MEKTQVELPVGFVVEQVSLLDIVVPRVRLWFDAGPCDVSVAGEDHALHPYVGEGVEYLHELPPSTEPAESSPLSAGEV